MFNLDSREEFLQTITTSTISQTVNDVEIDAMTEAATKSASLSTTAEQRAEVHFTAQEVNENKASENSAAAENAQTESVFAAKTTSAQVHDVLAEQENTMGNADARIAQESHFESAGLEAAAQIKETVAEVSERTEFAMKDIAERTEADHEDKVRKEIAVTEQEARAALVDPALEKEMRATAEHMPGLLGLSR